MKKWLVLIVLMVAAFLLGSYISPYIFGNKEGTTSGKPSKQPLYWVAPMNPNFRSDKPGISPMGMDLIPIYAEASKDLKISPEVINNLSVRIEPVQQGDFIREIQSLGYVTADENLIEHIHTYTDGWIEELIVKWTGEEVEPNELLFRLFSPKIVNAQQEYLLAIKSKQPDLIDAAEQKLQTFGVTKKQLDSIKKEGVTQKLIDVHAEHGGIVSEINVREGMYVKPVNDVMTIEDLRKVWIIVDVFERQANWVKKGQRVTATLPFDSTKIWEGEVDYIYPRLDPITHTLKLRLKFDNPDLKLKPDMYANVTIYATTYKDVLTIPTGAIIRTGKENRVVLALGKGYFRSQKVTIGEESAGRIVIQSGLKPGDNIVSSAEFLIDSESNLKSGLDRIDSKKE
jgi:membrane fusion protein, copper/silver efflux system